MKMNYQFVFLVVVALSAQRSFTSPVPNLSGIQADQEVLDEVQQLESLRRENIKRNSTENRHSGSAAPQPEPNAAQMTESPPEYPDGDSSPQSNSRSAIFRHRGITQAKKSKAWHSANQANEEYIKFSPTDLAEYVFRTGDEEGVAVAVEELVREGMMGRTDAINYLQDVKQELAYMRDQYEKQKNLQEMRNRAYPKPQVTQRLPKPPREQFISGMDTEKREPKIIDSPPASATTTEHSRQVMTASTPVPRLSTHSAGTTPRPKNDLIEGNRDASVPSKNDDMKRKHVGKEPARASYYDELSHEEIIYQLAKDMFTQIIMRGDQTAEDTLLRLKVLEIVSAALVDSLREYQGLLPENQAPALDEAGLYRMQPNGFAPGQRNMLQPSSSNNRPKSS